MKKRILIASHSLNIGGAESSLIGYLTALSDRKDVETELFLYRHEGELMEHIPESIRLLPEKSEYACLATPIKRVLKKGRFLIAAGRWWGKRKAAAYRKKHSAVAEESAVGLEYSHKYTKRFMPQISDKEYDLAVSFLTPHYFAAEKLKARKKIAFIHTDYSYITVDRESELKMWDAYDHIAAVSEAVRDSFTALFPPLAHKVLVLENINPTALIRKKAEEKLTADEMPEGEEIKLLSVGRFCHAKNFESIPKKLKMLLDVGIKAKWYIIGYGDDRLIRQAIAETGTEDSVIILGKRTNPYPYIKRCDIYVQPSRYEGKAVTVLEAQILGKPVVISDFATAASQLTDGVDGVVAPMADESFVLRLGQIIADVEGRRRLSANCLATDYSGREAADKLIKLI
ncbi:MAG: glycosyltransferase [Clostridia bacterium]|nr:glycosyltransferase [Clostridia bacterium]